MSSISLKRSAATLGVVAGLLAAAAPAGAQLPPTTNGLKAGSADILVETVTVKAQTGPNFAEILGTCVTNWLAGKPAC